MDIDKSRVDIDTSIDFASLTSAFLGGEGDFVNLFEPNATKLASLGYGYVVASIGEASGEVPYTAFNARKKFIEKNEELLMKFASAIDRGLKYCQNNDASSIASTIISQFPDTSINDLETIIERYKAADSWLDSPFIERSLFENLEDIMIASGEIDSYVPYEDLVINLYTK